MPQGYDLFFSVGMFICAAMIVLWLFRIKSRGASAYLMAGAFATFGLLLYSLKSDASRPVLATLIILLVTLLISDAYARSARSAQ